MVVTGLALILVSAAITLPWLAVIGLVILLAAYIVPNLVSGPGCHGQGCSPSAQTSGEDEPDE